MARSADSFNRTKSTAKPQPTVLVICEDLKSGKRYVEDAALHFRIKVAVDVVHLGKTDPKNIVEEGIRQKKKYDKVFCFIDRDTHANWGDAINLAAGQDDLEVVASYPCFEYWLILHFNANRKPYSREGNKSAGDCCVADLRRCQSMDGYEKGKDESVFAALRKRLSTARKNAANVLQDAKEVGDFNPSTRVHELIDYFEKLEAALDD